MVVNQEEIVKGKSAVIPADYLPAEADRLVTARWHPEAVRPLKYRGYAGVLPPAAGASAWGGE